MLLHDEDAIGQKTGIPNELDEAKRRETNETKKKRKCDRGDAEDTNDHDHVSLIHVWLTQAEAETKAKAIVLHQLENGGFTKVQKEDVDDEESVKIEQGEGER
jgi:ABC-type Zn2+ transport system substrate-binding protein/surface adhesin